eukprot:scaffold16939_cov51-Attheya_sp.AAC.4
MVKLYVCWLTLVALEAVSGFLHVPPAFKPRTVDVSLKATPMITNKEEDQLLYKKLDTIAHKLKLQVYDVDTGVYGMDSKDPLYGIENIRTGLAVKPSLGIELTEVAHSDLDDRGLVLVSKVLEGGNAAHKSEEGHSIQVGDTIVGVFVGDDYKESTTGLNYDETVATIEEAKKYAADDGIIFLELNRVVKKAKVKVIVEQDKDTRPVEIDALAGDNLRLLLMHHHQKIYDPNTVRLDNPFATGNCGGEGICGTCLVSILGGWESLNKKGPQEQEITTGRPDLWRASCKTIIGADNKEATIRVKLHPQSEIQNELLHPGKK